MTSTPLISIVMPSYQQVQFVEEAARSVLTQEGVDVELIVMDPGSTDGTRERLDGLKEIYGERLQLHYTPDKGQADAINRGFAMARGHILGWLNSDDRLRPGALQRILPFLDNPEPSWLYGRCGIINDRGRQVSPWIVQYKNFRGRRFSYYKLLTEDFIPQMATFWNRSMWITAGELDTKRHLAMDYDLFLRFAKIAEPTVITEYLADFRVHVQAKSSRKITEHFQEAYTTAREHAVGFGLRGTYALFIHRIFSLRTQLVYRIIKP